MINRLFRYVPIAIRYTDRIGKAEKVSDDLYCTGLAGAIKENRKIIIDCRRHACAGGNYFVGGRKTLTASIKNIYVDREYVMKNGKIAGKFLALVGKNPHRSRYIVFQPLRYGHVVCGKGKSEDIILGITDARNLSRILGLAAYDGFFGVDVVPAASTCAAVFRPAIAKDSIHVNFIDTFDREYQCKGFFTRDEIIVSMSARLFARLAKAYAKSSHGGRKPTGMRVYPVKKLKPAKPVHM